MSTPTRAPTAETSSAVFSPLPNCRASSSLAKPRAFMMSQSLSMIFRSGVGGVSTTSRPAIWRRCSFPSIRIFFCKRKRNRARHVTVSFTRDPLRWFIRAVPQRRR